MARDPLKTALADQRNRRLPWFCKAAAVIAICGSAVKNYPDVLNLRRPFLRSRPRPSQPVLCPVSVPTPVAPVSPSPWRGVNPSCRRLCSPPDSTRVRNHTRQPLRFGRQRETPVPLQDIAPTAPYRILWPTYDPWHHAFAWSHPSRRRSV